MPMVQDKVGGLYRIAPDGSSRCVIDGLGCANGLGWSPDGKTMYFHRHALPRGLGVRL